MPTRPAIRDYQCLMIEKDDRRYFTHEENLPQLLEFCKSFDMKMSVVKASEAPILDISDLPKAVCEPKKTCKAVYEVVRPILPFDPAAAIPLVRTRQQILETAKSIKVRVLEKFEKGEAVSRDMLEEEFPDATITSATFMQHVRNARKELEAKGYSFERIAPGCYRGVKPAPMKDEESGDVIKIDPAMMKTAWKTIKTPYFTKPIATATMGDIISMTFTVENN